MTRVVAVGTAIFSLLPCVVVLLASLTAGNSLAFPPQGLSLKWYFELFSTTDFGDSLIVSAILALLASVLAIIVAAPAAFAIVRYRFRGATAIEAILLSPLAVPHLVLGISILQIYSYLGYRSNLFTLLLGHMLITVPFVLRLLVASLSGLDRRIEQAAASLGANPRSVLFSVIFPQMRLSIVGAFLTAYILSFDELSMTVFLVQPGYTTMPVLLFGFAEADPRPIIHAASVFLLIATWAAVFLIDRFVGVEKIILPGRQSN
jgi:putative spermidine/putrescine transport system permease protein